MNFDSSEAELLTGYSSCNIDFGTSRRIAGSVNGRGVRHSSCDSYTASSFTMPISPSPSSFAPSLPSSAPLSQFNTLSNPKHRRTLSTIDTEGTGTRNSSLQKIWAEDYYDSDEEGERDPVFEQREIPFGYGLGSPPPAATLTSPPYPRSIPLSAEEEAYPARQPRTHQRSLTSLLPFLSSAKSRSPERKSEKTRQELEREREEEDFMPTLTGDKEGVIKLAAPRGGLASWFTGSSAPVSVGIPIMDQDSTPPSTNLSSRDPSPERQGAKLRKRPTLPSLESNSSMCPPGRAATPAAAASRFNFFSSPKTPSKTQMIQLPSSLNDDEFLTLDISTALFPSGSPNAQDPFSPAAFKNLLMNAEGLLLKLQTAYKLRTISLHDLSAEKEAMSEELEEAEMRAKALKSQLEDMARRVTQADSTIAELATELAQERQKREDEREARERSIAIVRANGIKNKHHSSGASSLDLSISTKDEDLGFPSVSRSKWRNRVSAGSELNTEGESDTEEDSVFSRSRSPTVTSSSVSIAPTVDSTPEILQASFGRVVPNPSHGTQRPKTLQQRSTFQKILTGMSSPPVEQLKDPFGEIGMGEEGCSNCRGKDASVAWDTVGLLRAENKGLKERVGCLENAVDGALRLL